MKTRPLLEQSYEQVSETQQIAVSFQLPAKLACLLDPATTQPEGGRFLVIHGGRGSAKSQSIAEALLHRGTEDKLKILCCREIQNSIRDSVHALLKYCIELMGLQDFYDVQADGIFGRNGTAFIFKGLRANASEIKSMQGIDIVWVEEADKVSAASWKYLIPTVRAEYDDGTCSQIIISFNPELEEDYTYQNFVVDPPSSARIIQMNWRDNPWFPKVLDAERLELWAKAQNSKRKMEEYMWIWEGQVKSAVEGAVFSEEMALATAQGRITEVPYYPGVPVDTYWDLGRSDQTAIWLVQHLHVRRHVINFYENTGFGVDHYLGVLQELAEEHGYVYGTHYLPHDADNFTVGMRSTVTSQVRGNGLRKVQIVRRPVRKSIGIQASRTVLGLCYFDREKCDVGLSHLRRYHYGISPTGVRTLDPVHDEHSNAADAIQTFGLADKAPRTEGKMPPSHPPPSAAAHTGQGWMR